MKRPAWSTGEERALIEFQHLGAEFCARTVLRSRAAVKLHAEDMRRRGIDISFKRRPGEFHTEKIPAQLLERALHILRAPTCPRCGSRPIDVPATGLCLTCHKRLLRDAHKNRLSELIAHSEYNAAKKRVSRFEKTGELVDDDELLDEEEAEAASV